MYVPDTILTLKEPKSTDEKPFPYDRVRVVNVSPVTWNQTGSTWEGGDAKGVIIEPLTEFAGNLDEPFGKIKALYDVESVPETEVDVTTKVRVFDATTTAAGETPEDVFKAEAPGDPAQNKSGKVVSPLTDPRPKAGDGPLGNVEPTEAA